VQASMFRFGRRLQVSLEGFIHVEQQPKEITLTPAPVALCERAIQGVSLH
jgi:hypothetical protein